MHNLNKQVMFWWAHWLSWSLRFSSMLFDINVVNLVQLEHVYYSCADLKSNQMWNAFRHEWFLAYTTAIATKTLLKSFQSKVLVHLPNRNLTQQLPLVSLNFIFNIFMIARCSFRWKIKWKSLGQGLGYMADEPKLSNENFW